ncbi:hypothetical protein LZ30DRAFT_683031 [Colletotrichum cereale]|nr:hypothetical protein LZ30DRAFT_683031 [Colletotrichum cereale]
MATIAGVASRLIVSSVVSLQPLKPAASTSLENSGTGTGTVIVTPIQPSSQTLVPGSTKQKGFSDEAHGFGILQHTGPPSQDDVPGLYRDGRVRNPVPSKLKGKTDARKGNFGVMHIDLSTTNETQERVAAAKRTSEGTQLAAKRAQTDRYVPFKRSKFVYRPEDQVAPSSQQPDGARQKTLPLTVAETKAEQVRLLTLLRNLQPVLVVDQLCKALAFFGEVSSAQSSANGAFPDSARANGPGSLFVGWLAEIFPALGQGSIPSAQHPPLKRPRGRPKGSKNMKGKKDELARKRFIPAASLANSTGDNLAISSPVREFALDDSWVDVDDNTADNEGEVLEGHLERSSTTPSRKIQVVAGPNASDSILGSPSAKAAPVTSTLKRRGRPKGSKNRPKHKIVPNDETQNAQDVSSAATGSIALPNEVADDGRFSAISIPSNAPKNPVESGTVGVKKRKPGPGRPKGSKNRPKETGPASEHDPQSTPALTNIDHHEQGVVLIAAKGASQASSAIKILPPMHIESHQPPQPPQNTVGMIRPPLVSEPAREAVAAEMNGGGNSKGIKRKRKSAQEENRSNPDGAPSTGASTPTHSPSTVVAVTSQSGSSPQLAQYHDSLHPGSTRTYHPAKRQRDSAELQQERALNGHVGQTIQPELHTLQPDSSAVHYDANSGGVDGINLHRSEQQLRIPASRSMLQQTPQTQQSEPDPPLGFSHHIGTPRSSQQQQQQQQQQQHQQQQHHDQHHSQQQRLHQPRQKKPLQQLSPTHNRPNASQHYHTNPNTGQMISTAEQDGNHFTASTSGGDCQGQTRVQQPAFNAQMAVPVLAQEANHRSPISRSMQHHSPAFQTRQARQSQSSGLSSFQDYSDSSFLEMAGLDSASQASLNINSTSYGIGDGNLQRASPNMNSSYGSTSSMSQPPFDGGVTESALRERMYHDLRRQ